MFRHLCKEVLLLFPLLFFVSIVAFFLVRCLPVDGATAYLNSIQVPVTQESLSTIRKELGLDEPVFIQYIRWLGQILHGNWGYSYQTKRPVLEELGRSFSYTALLTMATLIWIFVCSSVLGITSALHPNSIWDHCVRFLTSFLSSIPKFWLGFLLIIFFSLKLRLLPVQGAGTWQHLILPSFTLSCSYIAIYTKLLRTQILECSQQPFIFYTHTRGFSKRHIMFHHILPNTLPSLLSSFTIHCGSLFSGSVLVETVFGWPGLGRMCVDAVNARNYPMIQGYILFLCTLFVGINLLSECLCITFSPQYRQEKLQ